MSRTISFDRAVKTYDDTRSLPPQIMSNVLDKLVAVLERHDCHDLLEAGVGTGRFSAPLQQRGFSIVGLDVSKEMLDRARAKSVRNLLRGDIRQMPFKDGMFDAALTVHVLHLVKEWRQAISEIRRVSRKLYVSVTSIFPTSDTPTEYYRKRLLETGWPEIFPGKHERDLHEVVPPSEHEFAVRYEDEKTAEEVIALLEKRTYSFQWEVPEDFHGRIMDQLRDEYRGRLVKISRELYISAWKVDQL